MHWQALWRPLKRPLIIAFVIFLALWLHYLITGKGRPLVHVDGGTLGVTYHISYVDDQERNLKQPIDSLLTVLHGSLASYVATSSVARINQFRDTTKAIPVNNHFINLFDFTKEFHDKTNGFMEPGIVPLIYDLPSHKDHCSPAIDSPTNHSFQKYFELIERNGQTVVRKRCPKGGFNFDAIAKGYAVDRVAKLLEACGIEHYLIDIGGQVLARGTNHHHEHWQAGWAGSLKEDTAQNKNKLQFVLELKNEALASAEEVPCQTPFRNRALPDSLLSDTDESNTLLSTSVVRDSSCTEAQARAIAYQLMGLSKSWRHVQQQEGMSAYFMYRDSASGAIRIKYTENLSDRFVKQRFSEKTDK